MYLAPVSLTRGWPWLAFQKSVFTPVSPTHDMIAPQERPAPPTACQHSAAGRSAPTGSGTTAHRGVRVPGDQIGPAYPDHRSYRFDRCSILCYSHCTKLLSGRGWRCFEPGEEVRHGRCAAD